MTSPLLAATVGGLLIGLGAAILLAFNGRIAGISGVFDGAVLGRSGESVGWRWTFLIGLVLGGALTTVATTTAVATVSSTPLVIVAGLLVGFGTKMANGCTSGHGVCGNARLSPRSIVATLTFMAVGGVVVAALGGAA